MPTDVEVNSCFAGLKFQKDVRKPPDTLRRGQFLAGWQDWTVRELEYSRNTLEILTWRNLGYRFGQYFGERPSAVIREYYERVARLRTW